MVLEGKVTMVLPIQEGTTSKGSWSKKNYVLETYDQYPRKVMFSVFGGQNKDLYEQCNFLVGEHVRLGIDLNSREFNNKWYTDVMVDSILDLTAEQEQKVKTEKQQTAQPTQPVQQPQPQQEETADDELPF